MKYSLHIALDIAAPREKVFAMLTDLDVLPVWSTGLLAVVPGGQMHEGMQFTTSNVMLGQKFSVAAEVLKFNPPSSFELKSDGGAVIYLAKYELVESDNGGTLVEYTMRFEPRSIVIGFASSLIEQITRTKLEADLQGLKAILEKA